MSYWGTYTQTFMQLLSNFQPWNWTFSSIHVTDFSRKNYFFAGVRFRVQELRRVELSTIDIRPFKHSLHNWIYYFHPTKKMFLKIITYLIKGIVKGTLMQIWKSPCMFLVISKYHPENIAYLILTILELYTRKVSVMFVCKHTETIEYVKK